MGWWEKSSDDYLYHSDWNTYIKEVFTKIEDKRKLYFGKIDNDFAQYFGGILAFPSSATVYEANEHGVIELKPFAKVQGKDGELALYSPIPSAHATMPNHRDLEPSGWMYFDGEDDYVEIPDSESLHFNGSDNFTITGWFKLDVLPSEKGGNEVIVYKDNDFLVRADSSDDKLHFFVYDGTDWEPHVSTTTVLQANRWYFFVAVYDAGTLKIYLDGKLEGTRTNTKAEATTNPIIIGKVGIYRLDGIIDEIRIYNCALSDDEIRRLYEGEVITDGLVLKLTPDTIDEINGVWRDVSGNGNDGTIHGAVGCVPSELTYFEDAYRLQAGKLDEQYDRKEWWFKVGEDILPGKYRLVFRVKDTNNVVDDVKVTVTNVNDGTVLYEKTFTLSGSDWQLIETDPVDLTDLSNKYVEVRIEKATADENTIYVDYVTLDPYGWTPEIYYVVPDEDRHIGEVKVWDTMGNDEESRWVRVFNKEHKFVGDCVVENGLFRLWLSTTSKPYICVWDGSSWTGSSMVFHDNSAVTGLQIKEISLEHVVAEVEQNTEKYELVVDKVLIATTKRKGVGEWNIYVYGDAFSYLYPSLIWHNNVSSSISSASVLGHYAIEIGTKSIVYLGGAKVLGKDAGYDQLQISAGIGTPVFTFKAYQPYVANLFKEAEDATLSTAPDPLTYTDDFSEDTSARYMLDSSLFTWDTANGIVTTTTAPAKTVLRSLKFAHGDYNLKVKTDANGKAGMLLMWQPTEDSGYIVRLDEANDKVELVRVDNGTETVLASGSVTIDADTWYSLHVNVDSAGNFTVDVDGTTVISGVSDTAYSNGYVGLYNGAGSGSFDDLDVSAHEVVGRGAQVNRFIDDFDWDSSAEYSGDVDSFTWDTVNGIVKTTANNVQVTLNALKFGNGSYKVRINPKAISGDLRIHILFGRQEQGNGNANANGSGYVTILDCNNNEVKITRVDNGGSTILGSASYTFNAGDRYNVEVQWDTSTGDITVSVNGTQVVSVTDTTYNGGYAGVGIGNNANGDEVWFDDLEINAEEVTSSNNTCVILGGVNHGGTWDTSFDLVRYAFTAGVDIPLGRYLYVVRVKETDTTTEYSFSYQNMGDATSVSIDNPTYSEDVIVSNSYSYIIEPISLDEDCDGDTIGLWVGRNGKMCPKPVVAVDYFLLIPISGLESQTLMPQDIAVRSMVHTEYVDDAVDKAFDVRDEYIEPKKPMHEVTAYMVDAQSAKVDKIQIGYVSGDYGADWSGFDTGVLGDYTNDGSMVLVVNTNASASPKMKLYAYHSDVGWNEV